MSDLRQLIEIDWWYVFIAVCLLLICVKVVWSLIDWIFVEKLGIETRRMKQRRKDSELLSTTANIANTTAELAKTTAQNLAALQKKHTEDEEEFRKNLNNYIEENRKDRKALHDEMTTYSTNRINDRKQSLEIQKELKDSQGELADKVNDIFKKLDDVIRNTNDRFSESEKKENKRVQSEIKERIAQSYREYNKTKQISSMEREALEDLIETYESHGGENSFVHSVVQKEMYTWEEVE